MSKHINPYLDFVLGLDTTQFDLLCDSINQRKDRERYGATSFEEAALCLASIQDNIYMFFYQSSGEMLIGQN